MNKAHNDREPTLEVITTLDGLLAVRDEWESITSSRGFPIESTWDFNRIWWRHFGHNRKSHSLHTLAFRIDGMLVAIFPVYLYRGSCFGLIPLREIRAIGDDNFLPCYQREWHTSVWSLFIGHLGSIQGEWDVLELKNLDFGPDEARALNQSVPRDQIFCRTQRAGSKPILHLPDSYEAYLKERKSHFKNNLKRKQNRLSKLRSVTYEHVVATGDFARDYDDFLRLHVGRRSQFGDRSLFANQIFAAYHRELVECLMRKGLGALYYLRTDGNRCAGALAYKQKSTLSVMLTGLQVTPEEYQCGPGILLDTYVIDRSIAEGITSIDYGHGTYPYKYELGAIDKFGFNLIGAAEGKLRLKYRLHQLDLCLANLTNLLIAEWQMFIAVVRAEGLFSAELAAHVRARLRKVWQRINTQNSQLA